MIVVGIDENGLGPILGPMVVTACAFRADRYEPNRFWKLSDEQLPADDSKVIFKKNRQSAAETAVLKWLSAFGCFPGTATDLYRIIGLPSQRPCPSSAIEICRPAQNCTVPVFGGTAPQHFSLDLWNRFDALGIAPLRVNACIVCPGEFNAQLLSPSQNKLQLDFNLMIRLIQNLRRSYPGESIHAVCGKVGGTRNYRPWFEAQGINDAVVVEELPDRSSYQLGSHASIGFVKDGDSSHLPVAVASMVGKYIREISMHETNRLLAPDALPISGYRDSRTKQFIRKTTPVRASFDLPDRCFLRNH